MRAYWASPEGQKVKERLSRERKGRPMTEAQIQGRIRAAQRLLGIVPNDEPNPNWVTDEERAVAAREDERED